MEKSIPATGNALSDIIRGRQMNSDNELGFQTDIKLQINTLLWSVLPASATMKEAEDAATAFWCRIVELRAKYNCTGPGS